MLGKRNHNKFVPKEKEPKIFLEDLNNNYSKEEAILLFIFLLVNVHHSKENGEKNFINLSFKSKILLCDHLKKIYNKSIDAKELIFEKIQIVKKNMIFRKRKKKKRGNF